MLNMEKNLIIKKGHPFEYEWTANYDVFSQDYIDNTIPFIIKDSEGNTVIELYLNYGLSFIKFDNEENSRLIVSIFDTDIIPIGTYTYSYHPYTFSGQEIGEYHGTISAIETDQAPLIIRERRPWDLTRDNQKKNELEEEESSNRTVKPWDLFRSQDTPEGERASDELQEQRLSICKECPRYVKFTSQCLECGCIMKLKTKLAAAVCPLGKW